MFRLDVADVLIVVEALPHVSKVPLHEINILLIVLHVDPGVLNQDNAKPVEALGDLLALV